MKLNDWSVITTADGEGLALRHKDWSTELCIRIGEGGKIIVRAYGEASCFAVLEVDAGDTSI